MARASLDKSHWEQWPTFRTPLKKRYLSGMGKRHVPSRRSPQLHIDTVMSEKSDPLGMPPLMSWRSREKPLQLSS